MNSKAYEEGYSSGFPYSNPHPEDSNEFDDFERGWTQKLKRSRSGQDSFLSFDDWDDEEERTPPRKNKELNKYALARKK